MLRRLATQASKLRSAYKLTQRNTSTCGVINREYKFSPHNYHPLPVCLCRGHGAYVWDAEGRRYLDCLSGYGSVNQGHCHPRLVSTMIQQLQTLHQTSRAFHHDALGEFAETACALFAYEKVLPLNTGVEAVDASIKIARRWGYKVKGIPPGRAKVLFPEGNFWGRSLAAISSTTERRFFDGYDPFMPGFPNVRYNSQEELFKALHDHDICAFVMEPIQSQAGVIVPDIGYLMTVREMCNRYNILWIADEISTGLGRTGMLLGVDHERVRPDIVVLGKSLSGGMYPVSAVLTDGKVMDALEEGTKGSTFGGNPVGMRVATEALRVTVEECLPQNAQVVGCYMQQRLNDMLGRVVTCVRGRGLMLAVDINIDVIDPWEFSLRLRDVGILTRPVEHKTLRFMPPLCVTMQQVDEAMECMGKVICCI